MTAVFLSNWGKKKKKIKIGEGWRLKRTWPFSSGSKHGLTYLYSKSVLGSAIEVCSLPWPVLFFKQFLHLKKKLKIIIKDWERIYKWKWYIRNGRCYSLLNMWTAKVEVHDWWDLAHIFPSTNLSVLGIVQGTMQFRVGNLKTKTWHLLRWEASGSNLKWILLIRVVQSR